MEKGILQNLVLFTSSYNALEYLKLFLASWRLYAHQYKMIVVDDASSDGSMEYLCSLQDDQLTCVFFDNNQGQSSVYNTAIDVAKSKLDADYICLQNEDFVFGPLWDQDLNKYETDLEKGNFVRMNLASPCPPGCCPVSFYDAGVHPDNFSLDRWREFCLDPYTLDVRIHEEDNRLAAPYIFSSKYTSLYQYDTAYNGGGFMDSDLRFKIWLLTGHTGILLKPNLCFHFSGASSDKVKAQGLWIEHEDTFRNKWGIDIGLATDCFNGKSALTPDLMVACRKRAQQ